MLFPLSDSFNGMPNIEPVTKLHIIIIFKITSQPYLSNIFTVGTKFENAEHNTVLIIFIKQKTLDRTAAG